MAIFPCRIDGSARSISIRLKLSEVPSWLMRARYHKLNLMNRSNDNYPLQFWNSHVNLPSRCWATYSEMKDAADAELKIANRYWMSCSINLIIAIESSGRMKIESFDSHSVFNHIRIFIQRYEVDLFKPDWRAAESDATAYGVFSGKVDTDCLTGRLALYGRDNWSKYSSSVPVQIVARPKGPDTIARSQPIEHLGTQMCFLLALALAKILFRCLLFFIPLSSSLYPFLPKGEA